MSRNRFSLFLLLICCLLGSGCRLDTPVLQRGGNGRMGVLLNYSCGAHPCDAIDPAKPTIVFTHGWNPLPKRIRTTFAQSSARELRCRCGDSYNLLSWDWNGVKVRPFNNEPERIGRCQGQMLASALRARGVNPRQTQIVGHSLGTVAATQAAVCLRDLGPMAQLTLLDPPKNYHELIFCKLGATRHACKVENYWAPGCSGFGAVANYRGVMNYRVDGPTPMRGVPDLSSSNHVHVMLWYYETIRSPNKQCGFQNSDLRCYCGRTMRQPEEVAAETDLENIDLNEALPNAEVPPSVYTAAASDGSRNR
ncbi:alpha/beta hydrolase family protein [Adhaeretor mobilis]|uniref:Uncharacterized protein n=1 Tax=Adhaeretor mobilis TaxID=1930276 RepID=A0A517MZX8_9BACT|nr:hypothetical protein [Adhaeretor mobilis]QDT00433.1 hypothetical protein HG15A2_37710 [Adhaeretor mobilis]